MVLFGPFRPKQCDEEANREHKGCDDDAIYKGFHGIRVFCLDFLGGFGGGRGRGLASRLLDGGSGLRLQGEPKGL